ncbi:hypothetical protein [Methylovulum miyakonense]|uniref:hypothetical protein n=1 Tax=Methylovulum miyakonense TaxID=645578 RepID=UPI0012EC2C55|nr:hypothetical protein [Methylovulum miyakonense]
MMKKISPTPILSALLSLMALGQTQLASAHEIYGTLGYASGSIDQYQIHCFDNGDGNGANDHLYINVSDTLPVAAPLVSIQIQRANIAKNLTDAVDGNATSSPSVNFKGGGTGNDFYILTVDKTAAGNENYKVELHCLSSSGDHVGTEFPILTDQ